MIYQNFTASIMDFFTGKTVRAMLLSNSGICVTAAAVRLGDIPAADRVPFNPAPGGYTSPPQVQGIALGYDYGVGPQGPYSAEPRETYKLHVQCSPITFGVVAAETNIAGVLFYADSGSEATSDLIAYDQVEMFVEAGTNVSYVPRNAYDPSDPSSYNPYITPAFISIDTGLRGPI